MRLCSAVRLIVLCLGGLLWAAQAFAQPAPKDAAAAKGLGDRRLLFNKSVVGVQEKVRVLDLKGRELGHQVSSLGDAGALTVAAGAEPIVVKPEQITTFKLQRQKLTLPGGLLVAPAAAVGAVPGPPAPTPWIGLTVEPSPVPAVWDAQLNRYLIRLTFGLKLTSSAGGAAAGSPAALSEPVVVKLGFDGLHANEPAPLSLDTPGLQHEKTVELQFTPSQPRLKVLVRSSISDADLELTALPRLELRPVQSRMLGLGLSTVDIVVEHVRPHGAPVVATTELPVALEMEGRAVPEPRRPVIAAGSSSTQFAVRSAGLGPLRITATAGEVGGGTVLAQVFPTGPLLAVLIGSGLGGFARRFVKGARPKTHMRRLIEGMVVGLLVFVAAVLGIGILNLPPAIVATEAGAFLVGSVGGFLGVALWEKVAGKVAG